MSEQLYGLTKLALLNTAGYAKCVIPLDHAASICAPNNTGKSSVINALQFPLINDLRLTEWDGHDLDETRKFYFGSDQSYILLEANLPDGKVVIGVAGLGKIAGYKYQYFCYQGALDLDHFIAGNSIVKYNKLDHVLREKGLDPIELKPSELNAMLTGGATPYDSRINLRMIPLNNVSDAPVYKDIFRRILNLHKLTAQDVKRLLLPVFARHLGDPKVDFYAVWHGAFEKVNRDRRELKALESQQEGVTALEHMLDARAVYKGKLAAYAPKLDIALNDYQQHFDDQTSELSVQLEDLLSEKQQLEERQRLFVGQIKDLGNRQLELSQWFNQYDALHSRFELASNEQLATNLSNIRSDYERLSHSLQGASNVNLATLQHQLSQTQKQHKSAKLQLKNLEYNLYSRLREDLSLPEVQHITKLLNPDLLSLSTAKGGEVEITDDSAFSNLLEQLADCIKGGKAHLPGAVIDLAPLHSAPDMTSAEDKLQIKQQIDALEQSLHTLTQQIEVAADLAGKTREKERLYQDMLQAEQDVKDFSRYQQMQQLLDDQQQLQAALEEEEASVQSQLDEVQHKLASQSDRRNLLNNKLEQLKRQKERIDQEKRERRDHELELYSGRVTPYMIDIMLDFDNLADSIRSFNKDCQELRLTEMNIANTYQFIYNAGITKFETESDTELKYQKLIEAFHHLDKEREAIERRARVALTEVASTLKGLRNDLNRLHRELNSFNRGIWRQQISNLKDFKIEIVDRKLLVGHIDTILSTSEAYEQGDTFDLLAGNTVAERDINAARDYLVQAASEKGGLTLSDLFDIRFKVVNRAGEEEFFDKIDSAGSNGTRITIKLLCGMLFIRQLLAERERGKYRIPIYIDEAADIDPHNQQAIIETALSFGFVPIFASVKPQTSCRYIVPIRTVAGGAQNWVDEKDWIICEPVQPELQPEEVETEVEPA
ncbi:MAG: hypothetical protein ACI832_003031 [Rheinheimera aquimaris]|jgi:hypothetical protein|uniref:ATPase n=1 Tax=Rheinheimera aquimaris TaxID=412437 RepID=UPI000E90722E|nr:ATPase [Rheinheimera sp.]|tara:strand:+ start:1067 stop:3898 length:2832 start_codon:yes stop_codon:yes gene_type:complete